MDERPLRLLFDTLRWLLSHAVGVAVSVVVLFGAYVFVKVQVPAWELAHEQLETQQAALAAAVDQAAAAATEADARADRLRAEQQALREAVGVRARAAADEAARLRTQLNALEEALIALGERASRAREARDLRCGELCSIAERLLAKPLPGNFCHAAERRCEEARAVVGALSHQKLALESKVAGARRAWGDASDVAARLLAGDDPRAADLEAHLQRAQADASAARREAGEASAERRHGAVMLKNSPLTVWRDLQATLGREWSAAWPWLLGIVLAVQLAPLGWRSIWYWLLMPAFGAAPPIRLTAGETPGEAAMSPAGRSLEVPVEPGACLSVREAWLVAVGTRGEAPVAKRTRLFWRKDAPFISYAAGLFLLTEVRNPAAAGAPVNAVLSPGADPDQYLCRLDLQDHPGFVVHPRNVVGLAGDLRLETRWRLTSFHAWATRQLRFIVFRGTGSLILTGRGGVFPVDGAIGDFRIDEPHVVGFDTRLALQTVRTETFVPYLLGSASLVDDRFSGPGMVLREGVVGRVGETLVERTVGTLWTAVGKLLGF